MLVDMHRFPDTFAVYPSSLSRLLIGSLGNPLMFFCHLVQ